MRREDEEPPRTDARTPWWRKVPRPLPAGTPPIDPNAPFGATDPDNDPWRIAA